MAQVMVNFRMDEDLKRKMEQTCKEMGISISAAFTMFAAKVTREQRIPFEINVDPFFNKSNIERLERAVADANAGVNMTEHELAEVDE